MSNILNYKDFTILFVDDDLEYAESKCNKLRELGFNVFCAFNGEDAINILKKEKIDIVILDFYLPEFNGEDTVIAIREFNKEVVILIQTAYSEDVSKKEVLSLMGVQGCFDKTCHFQELLVWITACIKACLLQRKINNLYKEAS